MDMTREKLIETADLICENIFIFNHKWDMEVCKEPVKFSGEIEWNKNPFGDEEWTFMLNRHKYWTFLAKAYNLTGEEKYLIVFKNQINSWIDNVDIFSTEYRDCARTIEMGLRCINWIKALEIFEKTYKFDEELKGKIYNSLKEQCDILLEVYDDFRTLSNWGVIQNCGLMVFAFYYNLLEKDYFSVPLKRLKHQCKIQILPDGVHWEQSPMYQNEVLNCLLEIAVKFNEKEMKIPSYILKSIEKMGFSNLAMKKPNHHQPMQGDSDDTDLRDIITRCAAILRNPILKSGGFEKVDFESMWELDEKSIEEYNKMETKYPKHSSVALEYSGNYYLRDSFSEDGNYLWFSCGPIGSGHGHANLLHFDLTYKGEDFFVDLGRYTYVEGNEKRIELKNCNSHNTTIVDNKNFTIFSGSWGIEKAASPLKPFHIFNKKFDYVEGGHLGYVDLEKPVVTTRKIFYIKPELWVIVDEFKTEGEYSYKQFFNLDSGIDIVLESGNIRLVGKNSLNIKWTDEPKIKIREVEISKEYNKLEKTERIETEIFSKGSTTIFTVISPKNFTLENVEVKRGDGTKVPENEARAIKVAFGKGEEFIFFNSMKEINSQKKTYMLEDILFYGKTGFIEKFRGNKNLKIVKY